MTEPSQNQNYRLANATVSGKRVYMRNRDMAEFEKEIETSRLAAENAEKAAKETANPPSDQPVNPENPTSANETVQDNVDWKKRYADLQSDRDKKLADANKTIANKDSEKQELEKQLKEVTKAKTKYPTSEEELEQWCKEFPPLVPIIQTLALKAVEGRESELAEKVKELEDFKKAVAAERGRVELLKIHPDANEIETDPKFAQWFNEQETEIQHLVSSGDPKKIAKAITIYKKDLGIVNKSARDIKKEASKAVDLGPTPAELPKGKKTWYESEVAKMSARDYIKNEKEIELARAEDRYIYDISRAS